MDMQFIKKEELAVTTLDATATSTIVGSQVRYKGVCVDFHGDARGRILDPGYKKPDSN